jgi:hypothetical protein
MLLRYLANHLQGYLNPTTIRHHGPPYDAQLSWGATGQKSKIKSVLSTLSSILGSGPKLTGLVQLYCVSPPHRSEIVRLLQYRRARGEAIPVITIPAKKAAQFCGAMKINRHAQQPAARKEKQRHEEHQSVFCCSGRGTEQGVRSAQHRGPAETSVACHIGPGPSRI